MILRASIITSEMWAKSYVEASEIKRETETGVSLHVRSKPAKTNPNSLPQLVLARFTVVH